MTMDCLYRSLILSFSLIVLFSSNQVTFFVNCLQSESSFNSSLPTTIIKQQNVPVTKLVYSTNTSVVSLVSSQKRVDDSAERVYLTKTSQRIGNRRPSLQRNFHRNQQYFTFDPEEYYSSASEPVTTLSAVPKDQQQQQQSPEVIEEQQPVNYDEEEQRQEKKNAVSEEIVQQQQTMEEDEQKEEEPIQLPIIKHKKYPVKKHHHHLNHYPLLYPSHLHEQLMMLHPYHDHHHANHLNPMMIYPIYPSSLHPDLHSAHHPHDHLLNHHHPLLLPSHSHLHAAASVPTSQLINLPEPDYKSFNPFPRSEYYS